MKDASYALRVGYFTLLDSVLSVPVYDAKADDSASGNYVVISSQSSVSDSSKDSFQYEHSITVDVVTRFQGNAATSKTADDIANAISDAIQPTPSTSGLTVTGFVVLTLRCAGSFGDVKKSCIVCDQRLNDCHAFCAAMV